MRLIKLASLAAIAVVAAMAFIGAGSASASVLKTVFCKANQTLCKAENLWGNDLTIKALSELAVLLGTISVHCHSEVTILSETSHAHSILGKITSLIWLSCTGCKKATTTGTLPTGTLFADGTGGGKLETTSKTTVLLEGCTGFNFHCTASATTASLSFQGGAIGSTALSEANEVKTTMEGAFCGKEGKWDAGPGASTPYIITEVNGAKSGNIFISLESHAA